VNIGGLEELVAGKGYHSDEVLERGKGYQVRSYIPERQQKGRRNWEGEAGQQQAVYANRQRVRSNYGKGLLMHVGAFNLSVIFRRLLGAGTPQEWYNQGKSQLLFLSALFTRQQGRLQMCREHIPLIAQSCWPNRLPPLAPAHAADSLLAPRAVNVFRPYSEEGAVSEHAPCSDFLARALEFEKRAITVQCPWYFEHFGHSAHSYCSISYVFSMYLRSSTPAASTNFRPIGASFNVPPCPQPGLSRRASSPAGMQ